MLLVTDPPRPGRLELGFLAGLALLAVWAGLSSAWSPGGTAPVLELERGFLYVAAVAAAALLLSAPAARAALLAGVVAGAVALSVYALATRLFPGHVGGAYDPSSGYQLAEPIGYWNALGLLTAIAILLTLGFAAHGSLAARAAAAPALVVLLPTLYFTFSRGALLALAAGAAAQAVLDPRRARLLASSALLGVPAALAVLQASHVDALTAPGATLATAQSEGRRLAEMLVLLAAVAVAAAVALHVVERRIRLPERAGRLFVATVFSFAAVGTAVVAVAVGGRAVSSFSEQLPSGQGDLQRRLLSVSGNGRSDYWHVARGMARKGPLLGTGAGSFEAEWLRERPVDFHARDAHNLYLETLGELGPVGLALLLATLAVPLSALGAARRRPLGAAAGGAYLAFLLHAGVDWDWEVPAVTIPALFCASVVLAAARPARSAPLAGRSRGTALVLLTPVLVVALVAHVGNRAAAASVDAVEAGEPERALADARRAIRWAPWSEEPWQLRGEAELLLGDDAAARASLRRALELNPESWSAWLDLAIASDGDERHRPLERAMRLNPLSPEADELRTEP